MVDEKVWAQRKLSKGNPESLVYTDAQTAAGFILRLLFLQERKLSVHTAEGQSSLKSVSCKRVNEDAFKAQRRHSNSWSALSLTHEKPASADR